MVKSELGEHFEGPGVLNFIMSRLTPFFVAADPERAAQHYVRLATDPALANVSGMYFVSGKEKPSASSALSLDPTTQQQILDAAEAWAAPFLLDRQLPGGRVVQNRRDEDATAAGARTIASAEAR
jgi:hypothetical protein